MNFYSSWKFTVLLVAMLLVMCLRLAAIGHLGAAFIDDLLSAVVLLAATVSLCDDKRHRTVALLLGVPAILATCLPHVFGETELRLSFIMSRLLNATFLIFTVAIIVRTLLGHKNVTRDSLVGAFCGYVLLGVIWGDFYSLVETLYPGSFQVEASPTTPIRELGLHRLEYFSFVTLTTVGYGDMLPVSPLARTLAIWEAICGQFYLAVLVAGLINLRVARDLDPVEARPPNSG